MLPQRWMFKDLAVSTNALQKHLGKSRKEKVPGACIKHDPEVDMSEEVAWRRQADGKQTLEKSNSI